MNQQEKKRKILEILAVDDDYIVKKLEGLAILSEPFVRFHKQTGEIIISTEIVLTYEEKFILYGIGKYFANQYGVVENSNFRRKELKIGTHIPDTTSISNELNELVAKKIFKKIDKGIYSINPFKIEEKLHELREKYKVK